MSQFKKIKPVIFEKATESEELKKAVAQELLVPDPPKKSVAKLLKDAKHDVKKGDEATIKETTESDDPGTA